MMIAPDVSAPEFPRLNVYIQVMVQIRWETKIIDRTRLVGLSFETYLPFDPHSKPPKIVVGEGVRIRGKLVFERPVELYVHETAEIGPVTGAKVNRYSGSEPG